MPSQQRKLVLQELLSSPGADKAPLAEQDFYELCIEESDDAFRLGFIVKRTHARWSEVDGQVMFEEPEWERWPTLQKAKQRSEEWRETLSARDSLSRIQIFDKYLQDKCTADSEAEPSFDERIEICPFLNGLKWSQRSVVHRAIRPHHRLGAHHSNRRLASAFAGLSGKA